MSIITISRGSYTHGGKVAEKVAQKLGYECISREFLLEISDEYKISEIKLIRAIRDAPSFLERYTFGREKYINYIRAAILKHLSKDNIVYHGFAGHFFLKDVPHALKVRIIADMKHRIECMMAREGVSKEKAEIMVNEVDKERRRWSQKLYSIDTWNSRLYDLVINIEKITIDDAVDIITNAVKLSPFQKTPESQKIMDDLVDEAKKRLERDPGLSPFFEPMREGPWKAKK
ncbi:MAG: cytidylate kinase-like family protein [Deltaproteobacteria bacterium]|nr:MAG: cytidylate kinase-like family protein [Deltaproteobacteria bacterium]